MVRTKLTAGLHYPNRHPALHLQVARKSASMHVPLTARQRLDARIRAFRTRMHRFKRWYARLRIVREVSSISSNSSSEESSEMFSGLSMVNTPPIAADDPRRPVEELGFEEYFSTSNSEDDYL